MAGSAEAKKQAIWADWCRGELIQSLQARGKLPQYARSEARRRKVRRRAGSLHDAGTPAGVAPRSPRASPRHHLTPRTAQDAAYHSTHDRIFPVDDGGAGAARALADAAAARRPAEGAAAPPPAEARPQGLAGGARGAKQCGSGQRRELKVGRGGGLQQAPPGAAGAAPRARPRCSARTAGSTPRARAAPHRPHPAQAKLASLQAQLQEEARACAQLEAARLGDVRQPAAAQNARQPQQPGAG